MSFQNQVSTKVQQAVTNTCMFMKIFESNLVSFPTCLLVSCSVGTYYDKAYGRCVLCPPGTYQDEEGQMSCVVCPGREGRQVSKVEGARNMSECEGKTVSQFDLCCSDSQKFLAICTA